MASPDDASDDAAADAAVDTPLSFTDFLERMKDPAAADLVRSIRAFVKSFEDQPPDAERDAPRVQEFFDRADEAFRAHPAWRGATPAVLACAGEGLEKYVTTKIHARVFGSSALDAERDEALSRRISALSFVRPEHLEIPESHVGMEEGGGGGAGGGGSSARSCPVSSSPAARALALAQRELSKVNAFKAPRDKLVCILNACRVLSDSLAAVAAREDEERRRKKSGGGNDAGGEPPSSSASTTTADKAAAKAAPSSSSRGADDFLPLLIYALIRANPPRLASNLEYVQRFRGARRFHGEAAYFYTQLYAAASFIETVNVTSLNVDPDEFVARMVEAGVPDMQLLPPPRSVIEAALAGSEGGEQEGKEGGGGAPIAAAADVAPRHDATATSPTDAKVDAGGETVLRENPAFFLATAERNDRRPSTSTSAERERFRRPPRHNPLRRSSSAFLPPPTAQQLEAEGAELVLAADASGELSRDHRFLSTPPGRGADDLSLADVSELLRLYKAQVLRFEAISRAADARARAWEEGEGGDEAEAEERETDRAGSAPAAETATTTAADERDTGGDEGEAFVPSPPWVPPSTSALDAGTTIPPVADLDFEKLSLLPPEAEEGGREEGGRERATPLSEDIAHLLTPIAADAADSASISSAPYSDAGGGQVVGGNGSSSLI